MYDGRHTQEYVALRYMTYSCHMSLLSTIILLLQSLFIADIIKTSDFSHGILFECCCDRQ